MNVEEAIYEQAIYCEDDNECRSYCHICDILCIVRFYKNRLKSHTHINNIRKKKTIPNIST